MSTLAAHPSPPTKGDIAAFEVRLLGPVTARFAGESVPLGGDRERALLAALALQANHPRSVSSLIGDLWSDHPPPTAAKMVQISVSHLRRDLARIDQGSVALRTSSTGYELQLAPDAVDALLFERLVRTADAERATGLAAGVDYEAALGLWHGDALSDVRDAPFASPAAARLEELRLHAFECWVDEQQKAGRDAETVSQIRAMLERDPLRERLRARLMLALYRSGRQAEALQSFVDFRRLLSDELGIEPGPELQALQSAILNHDPALLVVGASRGPAPAFPDSSRDATPNESAPAGTATRSRALTSRGALALLMVAVVALSLSWAAVNAANSARNGQPVAATVAADSVAVLDGTTSRLVADVPIGGTPGPLVADDSSVWVGNVADRTLVQVDRPSRRLLRTIGLPAAPTAMADGDGIVWIGNGFLGTLSRYVIAADQQTGPFFPADQITGLLALSAEPGALWVGLPDSKLVRLDPNSVQVTTVAPLDARPRLLLAALGSIWATSFDTLNLSRIRTSDLSDAGTVGLPGDALAIAADDSDVFVATTTPDQLVEIDPQALSIVRTIALQGVPSGLVVNAGTAWLVDDSARLETIDLTSGVVTVRNIGRPISAIALEAGEVWATTR